MSNNVNYPRGYYPADWLHFDWYSGKWEMTDVAMIRESANDFIGWRAFWLEPDRCS